MNKILVTGYNNIDLDGAACAFAYAEFLNSQGTPAEFGVSGTTEAEPSFVFEKLGINIPNADKIIFPSKKIIICDASETRWLSKKIDPLQVIEVIDHRTINNVEDFKNAKIQIEKVGACATLIVEKFISKKSKPSREAAIALYLAIISNTVNFMSSLTTSRDEKGAEFLKNICKIPKSLVHEMFSHKSIFTKPVKETLEEDLNHYVFGGKKVCVLQLEIINASDFISKNIAEISNALMEFQKAHRYDHIFLTCIDIEKGGNTFVSTDPKTKKLLEEILDLNFTKNIAKRSGIIMRKEIIPMIKERLEKCAKQP